MMIKTIVNLTVLLSYVTGLVFLVMHNHSMAVLFWSASSGYGAGQAFSEILNRG